MARNGVLLDLARKTTPRVPELQQLQTPRKIVHVGHSFGTRLTSALLTTNGAISDGAVLTGYIPNKEAVLARIAAAGLAYAATNSPTRFSDRSSGYIVPETQRAIQTIFFGGDPDTAFTKEMLEYGDSIKQPATVAEWISGSALDGGYAPAFEGPLQFMVPEFDFLGCAGDCKGTYNLATLGEMYPAATAIDVHIQPNAGHDLTFHQNATGGYQATFDFFGQAWAVTWSGLLSRRATVYIDLQRQTSHLSY